MAKFTDSEGHEWELRLNVGVVQRVKDQTKVNLALVSKDTSWVDAIFGDPAKLVEVLYVLCEKQCAPERHNLSPEAFAECFDGPTLQSAGEKLAEGIADFFPRSRIAQALKVGWAKILEKADEEAVRKIEIATSTAWPAPTSAPESAALTPDP